MQPQLSFEYFSPKSVAAAFTLSETQTRLDVFVPKFSSVTCGTGGGSLAQTQETIAALGHASPFPVHPHIVCGCVEMQDLHSLAALYKSQGHNAVVALRGDAAPVRTDPLHNPCFPSVPDAVSAFRGLDLDVYVAAYPETHPRAASRQADLDMLKAKQDVGATAAITQFFADAELFLRFRDDCIAQGITLPLIPGILPVENWPSISKMSAKCGISFAPDLAEGFARAAREDRAQLMAVAHATEMCDHLIREGVEHLHFYTMNKANTVSAICDAIGVSRRQTLRKAA